MLGLYILSVGVLAYTVLGQDYINATFISTVKVPGRVKANSTLGHPSTSSGVPAKFTNSSSGAVRRRSLFVRQECPDGFPELCPEGFCCEEDTVCCDTGCCPSETPVCQPDDVCCPENTVACGAVDPDHCHPADTTCCGAGVNCPDTEECCGDYCCYTDENAKCCPGTDNGSVCCGEYEVCCDGWCCSEGATCDAEFGYCDIPRWNLIYTGGAIGVMDQLVQNACLGIRNFIGQPGVTAQSQVLTYSPGVNRRALNDCNPNRNPTCCSNRFVPAGQPGAGDPMSCEEYPPNTVAQGGAGAQTSCVDETANSQAGGQIGALVAGKHVGFLFQAFVIGIDCTTVVEADLAPCNA